MEYIFYYLVVLLLSFIAVYVITYVIPAKKNTLGAQGAFQFVVKKYDLNMDKKRVRLLSKILAFINSFIISIPITIVLFIELDRWLIFLASFILFVIMMLCLYNLIGFILKKKGW